MTNGMKQPSMSLMQATLATLILSSTASQSLADPAGLRLSEIEMPHHSASADVSIWYPNGGGGDKMIFADNAVFYGVEAALGANVETGLHPIVMFSHGMGGTTRAQAWLASALAQRGAVVMSVNHANSTWGDFDMTQGVRHWTRAVDLSVALDSLLANPDFEGHLDTSRIMAAGFSFGGWTALSLGGIRGNHDGIVAKCTEFEHTMEACDLLLSDDVNLQGLEPDLWNDSYADARITHVAAIDPGLIWGLNAEDVADIVPSVLLIGLGGPTDRMGAANFDQSGLVSLLPDASVLRIAPGFHFTAMPVCKPAGVDILAEDGDDPVCTDPLGTDRAAVHGDIVEAMLQLIAL